MSSSALLNVNAALYSEYYARIGEEFSYHGVDLLSDWHRTNLHSYANILLQVKLTDKAIMLIYS